MERNFIRPMRIGEIFDAAFFIMRQNFKTLAYLNLFLFLPAFIIGLLAVIGGFVIYLNNPMMFEGFNNPTPSFGLVMLILFGVLFIIFFGLLVSVTMLFNSYGVVQVYGAAINGRKITWKESLKGSIRGILFFFVAGLMIGGATSIVVLPISMVLNLSSTFSTDPTMKMVYMIANQAFDITFRLVISAFFFVVLPLIALEKINPALAIWRSCTLVWKNFWRTVGVNFLFYIIMICMYLVVITIFIIPIIILAVQNGENFIRNFDISMLYNPWLLISGLILLMVLFFLGFIFYNVGLGLEVLLYYDLRMRSEGYDILTSENVPS